MKHLSIILLILINANISFCQDIQSLNDYKDFKSIGETLNGKKVGEWIDLSIDSVIYRSGSYDSTGMPEGIWSVYFPNGDLRKTTEYINGKVINWSCYVDNKKVIEVSNKESIDYNTFKEILYLETYSMELNDNPYQYSVNKRGDFAMWKITYTMYYDNINILYNELVRLLRHQKFSGSLKKWNIEGDIRKDHRFIKGNDYVKEYIYNRNRLKYTKQIKNDTIKIITTYKKDGSVKMTEEK